MYNLSPRLTLGVRKPGRYCAEIKESGCAPRLMEFSKGTTTLGFVFQGGIILAVDSRASQGSFLASSSVLKVLPVTDTIMGTLAGCAADCIFWLHHLAKICHLRQLQEKEPVTVAAASKLLGNIFFQYKGYGLSAGIILGGYDYRGPQLYFLDDSCTRVKGKCFSCGSGSTYAYGILDSQYRFDLTVDEAVELGCNAIYHATHRDAGSGNTVTVYHIFEGGRKCMVDAKDVNELHREYCKQKGQPLDQL
ncbi:putative proteasome subunit beta type [Cardiosporidium cionae]|uniref:Proteasome subunit beta n=1 Tax=Cardiosporidium cionae TaxID=476202 RepID=A0ABQ7J6N3_9APIC|nr:putative proteasome subunit beta type [Cardiosporidium cionae]|eukprot:KAF8819649.1 putative proteasome subunit beta type [Cardiosporidium cionae]